MKQILNYRISWKALLMLPLVHFSLQGCHDDAISGVDLRYRAEDMYELEANNPAPITFQVKSTKPWEVIGTQGWYSISPDKGEAGETHDVTITCSSNKELDDRIDTISIKSDYWVGKRFVLLQKGIAYLNADGTDFTISKDGGTAAFQVRANQKWTARVTDGASWLSIVSGEAGELDGEVQVSVKKNNGERRVGLVELCDRHGVARCVVECVQTGVVLEPAKPENGKWFALEANAQQFEVAVETNADWTAEKNDENDSWFNILSVTSDKITLSVMKNEGQAVRQGIVLLKTKAEEGIESITKELKFKQINEEYTLEFPLNKTYPIGVHSIASNNLPGKYIFYFNGNISVKADAMFTLTWQWGSAGSEFCQVSSRLRTGGYAQGGTSPWNNVYNYANVTGGTKLDLSKPHTLGFKVEENADVIPAMTNCIWYVDGVEVMNMKKKNGFFNPSTMTWERVFTPNGELKLDVKGDAVTLEKYECTPVLDWGE